MSEKFRAMHYAENDERMVFFCPGCENGHYVRIKGQQPVWDFNGDLVSPTVSPSLLIKSYRVVDGVEIPIVCHSFIKAGRIEFLNDCTHKLAGQTVDLEDVKEWIGE